MSIAMATPRACRMKPASSPGNATLGVAYSGQFGDRATDQSVKGNLAMKF
jgi:uncharacterized protein with beta-barrel porin domain